MKAKIALTISLSVFLLWGYTVKYWSAQFSFYEEHGYTRIKAPDFVLVGEPGEPELPSITLNYIIPPNVRVESLIIIDSVVSQFPGEYLIYPTQPVNLPGESLPWVEPDTGIYNSDKLFPDPFIRVVGSGIMDGARLVAVEVMPILYRPESRRLFLVEDIAFKFSFTNQNPPVLRPEVRGRYEQMVYDAVLRQTVENDYEVSVYYQKPSIVEEDQLGSLAPFPMGPGVIITPDEFKPYFQPYADWMTDRGIRTVLISPQTIYGYFSGRDNAEKIRNYIKYCYEHSGGTYFILGGDDYFLPVRYGIPFDVTPINQPHENDSIPCDHYFSDLTGKWECDNDDYWGELSDDSADCYADVFVARVTALDTNEVKNWITKVLHYEKTPGIIFDKALWINDGYNNPNAHNKFPSYFYHRDCNSVYADVAFYAIDSGYAYVNLNCHGNIRNFRSRHNEPIATIHNWWESEPSSSDAGLNWLTNVNKYFFVYGISCHCGAFDIHAHTNHEPSDTCIADAFIDAYLHHQGNQDPVGACGAVLQTRSPGGGYWNSLQTSFYEALFTQPINSISDTADAYFGVALALSKPRYSWLWNSDWIFRAACYCQNLFGSPATEAWTKTPDHLKVSHKTRIPTGPQSFTVIVSTLGPEPSPISLAKVCLNKPGDVYEVDHTNGEGKATFSINPRKGGTMKITVTRFHNLEPDYTQYYPSQTTCLVIPIEGGGQTADSKDIGPAHLCIAYLPTLFKGIGSIRYGVPEKGKVEIKVYDVAGSLVKVIKNEIPHPGYYEEKMDLTDFSSGVYFIVLRHNNEKVTKKFLLIK